MKRDSVSLSSVKKLSFYSDNACTILKGDLARDGRYVIYNTAVGYQVLHTDRKYYFINLPDKGFTKISSDADVRTILAEQAHVPVAEKNKSVAIYYDRERKYKKLTYDRSKIHNVEVNKRSTTDEVIVTFNSNNDYSYSDFVKQKFYIICKNALLYDDSKIKTVENVMYYSRVKFGIKKGVLAYDTSSKVDNIRIFVSDKATIKSIDSMPGQNCSYMQYEIDRIGASCDLEGYQQRGFIGESSDSITNLFSTMTIYELSNSVLQGSTNAYLTTKNGFMLYDTIGLVGATACFEDELGAVTDVIKVEEKNDITYSQLQWKDMCGYVKCKDGKKITDIVTLSNIQGFSADSIICPSEEDNKNYVSKYIGMMDATLSIPDIHIELFFSSLDDFTFKKTLTEKQKKENENIKIDVVNTDALLMCTNERVDINLVQNERTQTVVRAGILCKKKGFGSVGIETYEMISVVAKKKGNIVQTSMINGIANDDFILNIMERDESTSRCVIKFSTVKKPKNVQIGYAIDGEEIYNAEIEETAKNGFNIKVWLQKDGSNDTAYMFFRDVGTKFDKLHSEDLYIVNSMCKIYSSESLTFSSVKELKKTVTTSEKTIMYCGCDFYENDYLRFRLGDEYYFIKDTSITDCTIKNEIEEIDGADMIRYNVLDLPRFILMEDTNNDVVCDINTVLDKVKYDTSKENESHSPADLIYKDKALYNSVNQLVIKCLSMWNEKKDLQESDLPKYGYIGIEKNESKKIVTYLKDQFWLTDTVRQKSGINGNIFYYFHPISFLEFVASKMTQEYNPYFGKEIASSPSESHGGLLHCVVSNPGFAPVSKSPTPYYSFVNGKKEYYTVITGLFNENYTCVGSYWKKYIAFYHEGVDFAAGCNNVKSFIFGKVITYGTRSGYGNIVLIKHKTEKKVYLLAHLSRNDMLAERADVYPGQIVAITGNSGTTNSHLHLTIFDISKMAKSSDTSDFVTNKKPGMYIDWAEGFTGSRKEINPFNDQEKRRLIETL